MAVLVDTSVIPVPDRAAVVRSLMTRATAPHDIEFLDGPDAVVARVDYWQLDPDLALLQHRSTGIRHVRDHRHARVDGPDRLVLVLHDGAQGSYLHDGVSVPLNRGSLYATDLNAQYSYARPGRGVARIAQLERSRIGLPAELIRRHGSRLAASPLYPLLRHHITAICGQMSAADRAGASPIAPALMPLAEATVQLTRGLLLTAGDPDERSAQRTLNDHLLERIEYFVRLHHADRDLTPDRIAAEHNISRRYLFKLWSSRPASLVDTIVGERLHAARLRLGENQHVTVSAIAHACGFSDVSHFSRRFKQTYGVSPVEWRRRCT